MHQSHSFSGAVLEECFTIQKGTFNLFCICDYEKCVGNVNLYVVIDIIA